MRQQSVSAKGEHNGGAHCTVSASRLLKFAGDIGLFDMDRDCRGALQIGKLPLLAMSLSMSGTAAWSSSSLQPLGRPFAGRMSIRCIMPMSSLLSVWQCATKQPTVTGLKYVRNVIDPGGKLLMFTGLVQVAGLLGHTAAGTSKVSCHSGCFRVIPFIFVTST